MANPICGLADIIIIILKKDMGVGRALVTCPKNPYTTPPLNAMIYLQCVCPPYEGTEVQDAVERSLRYMGERVQGAGGAIAVSPSGRWAATFTTERMAWAAAEQGALWYGLNPQEKFQDKLSQWQKGYFLYSRPIRFYSDLNWTWGNRGSIGIFLVTIRITKNY